MLDTTQSPLTQRLIANFQSRTPLRTGSLIVTLFGDAIAPRGGSVSLTSLIQTLSPLGLSHRAVRTAVYRLVQDGVLTNRQEGRLSYYALTPDGHREFDAASQRIYAITDPEWHSRWHLILAHSLCASQKTKLRKDLEWLGFGQVNADLFAHPSPDHAVLGTHLERLGCANDVIVMDARIDVSQPLLDLVQTTWPLSALETAYAQLTQRFAPCADKPAQTPLDAFYLRTFVIHEYRKILLRDPRLPNELLPDNWRGHQARQLVAHIYHQALDLSEEFIDAALTDQHGPLPAPDPSLARRFRQ